VWFSGRVVGWGNWTDHKVRLPGSVTALTVQDSFPLRQLKAISPKDTNFNQEKKPTRRTLCCYLHDGAPASSVIEVHNLAHFDKLL
jgi:hypothetical protein